MSCKDRKNDIKMMAANALRNAEKGNVEFVDVIYDGQLQDILLQIPNPDDVLVITRQGQNTWIATMSIKITENTETK